MLAKLIVPALAMTLALPAAAQDAKSILRTAAEKQDQRWQGITDYALEQAVEGAPFTAPVYFEKGEVAGVTTFRRVPHNEWNKRRPGTPDLQPEHYEIMADAYDTIGAVHMREAGPIVGPLAKWTTDDAATFLRFAAEAERTGAAYADEDTDAANVQGMAQFGQRARLVGTEDVNGRSAFHLTADISDLPPQKAGQGDAEMKLSTASLWIDTGDYVPLRMLFEGQLTADGRSTPIRIETRFEDYQPAQSLLIPRRQVMRIEGLMESIATDPKQKAELEKARRDAEKARADMEKMESEMAQMPPAVRDMIKGQMDKAMAQLRMLTEEGAIESVMTTRVISVNEGPPFDWRPAVGGSR